MEKIVPTPRENLHGIQMLRAIAALAVVTHHALEESNGALTRFSPGWLTTSGASGVDIFFVISGFIMLHVSFPARRAPPTAENFLFRRATRIYPFYWLCCLAMLFVHAIGFLKHHHWASGEILTSLALVPNRDKVIGVSWTLVYEMYFYLIFSVTLLLKSKSATVLLATVSIIGFHLAGTHLHGGPLGVFLADPIALEFCMGLWLAWAFSDWRVEGAIPRLALGLIGFGLLAVAPLFVAHRDTSGLPGLARVLAWGLPAILIVQAFLCIGPPRNTLTRFAVLLGDASYALYLTHVFVMIGYAWLLKSTSLTHDRQFLLVPVAVIVSIIIAICAHLTVERPLLGLIRIHLRAKKIYSGLIWPLRQ
jgi:exopolysaccharide production protein ExoZ